ncbi:SEC-C metal-binding domain-containing protein [Endozoicomonas euniceicola]|uniref:SEC-C metal-binding domain-containing protein n=1 Tax=Endozoicomonas euniceicola TaxID=1234143 RepID=A0ABY6GZV4_9GAMM|nr:SEC-C metal-binding domain-containing protein [Endozoicomonas euniceicola]UYM18092.1 SEC-C metal-binding domain-containing protein [Endozoicomonas euniceicola]
MLDDILRASEAGFIGEMINLRSFERAKEYCEGTPEQWFSANRERLVKEFGYIREADKELEAWGMNQVFEFDPDELDEITAMIEEKSRQRAAQNQAIGNIYNQIFHESSDTPFIREGTKTGRNAPCPCGSGKKYKKCCGR